MSETIIELKNACKVFEKGQIGKDYLRIKALDEVSLSIRKGETLGLVGESGSGKTTLGRAVLGLESLDSGEVFFKNQAVSSLTKKEKREIAKQLQIIFQDPYSALNPKMTALELVAEPLLHLKGKEKRERALAMLQSVGIEGESVHKLPKEFSGGQRQRIGIARAIINHPEFIVCDEPTSALDVSIQAQILKLLKALQEQLNLSYLFISHDLSVVRYISDRIAVLYRGKLVEVAPAQHLFDHPQHAYTQYLLAAKSELDPLLARKKIEMADEGVQEFTLSDRFEWRQYGPDHFVRIEVEEEDV